MECQITNAHLKKKTSEISYASHSFNCRLELNNCAGFLHSCKSKPKFQFLKARGGIGKDKEKSLPHL